MANQWLRLWHDMPTDPKWRTVARVSGQRIGDVIAVFTHMLVCASNANERGRTQSFNCEDVASALDLETEQVAAIVDAMQGRVLDGDRLKGWEKRQVAREDGSAERARAWRESRKQEKEAETQANAIERNRTPDTDTEKSKPSSATPDGFAEFWQAYPKKRSKGDAEKAWKKLKPSDDLLKTILRAVEVAKRGDDWRKDGGQFIPHPATWLNAKGWEDEQGAQSSSEVVSLFRGCL